jgi:hydroxymethylpyrimidine/phosphomethylpyrimidine kinase
MINTIPAALTIAGSDCSAGAGLQADLKTFQHFNVHGLTAVTAIVSETANVVRTIHPVPVDIVTSQISLLLECFPIKAIKTGMLVSAAHVEAIARLLKEHPSIPLVVDPVMIASTGASLLEDGAIEAYRQKLLPLAGLITPNLPEAERLLEKPILDESAMSAAAHDLSELFGTAVLLKGGHLPGGNCTDILASNGKIHRFSVARVETPASHGTGCTLSAAIAACLARAKSLPEAVELAKNYLGETLRLAYEFHLAPAKRIHALNQGTSFLQNEA